ncbi:MAG TPA: hypothetical protein VGG74_33755 [Kofleriaceae bacterium]|jgi:hypothetical protein
MGLFRYIVQGFGWEIGSQAAREGIAAATAELEPEEPRELDLHKHPPQAARFERIERLREARRKAEREAEIDALLEELRQRTKQ